MFVLKICYDEEKDGFKVEGPIKHPILCYGMLERARDVIKDYSEVHAKKGGIEVVDPAIMKTIKKTVKLS